MMITEEELSDEEMYRQDLYRNIKTVRDLLDACEDRGIDIIHTDIMKECEGFSDEYIKFFYTTNQDFGISSTVDGYSDLDSAYLLLYKIHNANHEMLTFDNNTYWTSDDQYIDVSSELLQHLINQFIYVDVQDDS